MQPPLAPCWMTFSVAILLESLLLLCQAGPLPQRPENAAAASAAASSSAPFLSVNNNNNHTLHIRPPPRMRRINNSYLIQRSMLRDKVFQSIFNAYKIHERPTELTGEPTNVTVYIRVLSINSVNVINMEYSADMYLRQAWNDPRLSWEDNEELNAFRDEIASPTLKQKVWLPDLFFRNGKHGYVDEITMPNYLMRLRPNGDLLYSQKISMRFSCQMHLHIFPMDTQHCEMNIGSYGYTVDHLKFIWRQEQPIIVDNKMSVSEFYTPIHVTTSDCTVGFSTATGQYTCLLARFRLQRQLGSYLSSVYIPSILIINVSWLNFWVSIDAVPARITLGLLTLLGILTQATTVSSSLPRVSYVKAIDVWVVFCIVFVIGALLEFVVASMISRRNKALSEELANRCVMTNTTATEEDHFILPDTDRSSSTMLSSGHDVHQRPASLRQMIPLEDLPNKDCEEWIQMEFARLQEEQAKSRSLLSQRVRSLNKNHHNQPSGGGGGGGGSGRISRQDSRRKVQRLYADSIIDWYSRFVFPLCFLVYNGFYWSYYMLFISHDEHS